MSKFWKAAWFLAENFGVPIVFFIVFRIVGAKEAIAVTVAVASVQIAVSFFKGRKLSPFFQVAGGFTILFGAVDLILASPRFFRFEPFAQNMVMATALFGAWLARIPVAEWFMAAFPPGLRPQAAQVQYPARYLRALTLVWVIYLYIKAVVFFFLALRVDLAELVALRTAIGGGSLLLMLVAEVAYRHRGHFLSALRRRSFAGYLN